MLDSLTRRHVACPRSRSRARVWTLLAHLLVLLVVDEAQSSKSHQQEPIAIPGRLPCGQRHRYRLCRTTQSCPPQKISQIFPVCPPHTAYAHKWGPAEGRAEPAVRACTSEIRTPQPVARSGFILSSDSQHAHIPEGIGAQLNWHKASLIFADAMRLPWIGRIINSHDNLDYVPFLGLGGNDCAMPTQGNGSLGEVVTLSEGDHFTTIASTGHRRWHMRSSSWVDAAGWAVQLREWCNAAERVQMHCRGADGDECEQAPRAAAQALWATAQRSTFGGGATDEYGFPTAPQPDSPPDNGSHAVVTPINRSTVLLFPKDMLRSGLNYCLFSPRFRARFARARLRRGRVHKPARERWICAHHRYGDARFVRYKMPKGSSNRTSKWYQRDDYDLHNLDIIGDNVASILQALPKSEARRARVHFFSEGASELFAPFVRRIKLLDPLVKLTMHLGGRPLDSQDDLDHFSLCDAVLGNRSGFFVLGAHLCDRCVVVADTAGGTVTGRLESFETTQAVGTSAAALPPHHRVLPQRPFDVGAFVRAWHEMVTE
jgi:hypothetical protein